jgi:hypothetical protein
MCNSAYQDVQRLQPELYDRKPFAASKQTRSINWQTNRVKSVGLNEKIRTVRQLLPAQISNIQLRDENSIFNLKRDLSS